MTLVDVELVPVDVGRPAERVVDHPRGDGLVAHPVDQDKGPIAGQSVNTS